MRSLPYSYTQIVTDPLRTRWITRRRRNLKGAGEPLPGAVTKPILMIMWMMGRWGGMMRSASARGNTFGIARHREAIIRHPQFHMLGDWSWRSSRNPSPSACDIFRCSESENRLRYPQPSFKAYATRRLSSWIGPALRGLRRRGCAWGTQFGTIAEDQREQWIGKIGESWSWNMAFAQVGAMVQLKDMGLFKSQGLIGGEWTDAHDGRTLAVNNPATGELIANVPFMGKIDAQKAIAAASVAFQPWSKRTAFDRCKLLRKWFDLILENKDDLAKLMVLENGKPLAEATGEVHYGAGFVEYYAEEGKRVYGDIIPSPFPTKRMLVMKQAVGVVGAITPWNFPLAMITRKVAPALAAGCTIVVKPAELTPLTALAAAQLALQAGIPSGVLNVVMGDAIEIGAAMMESNEVRKITFTGSTHVGKILMAAAAKTVKKISLELGGNAPLIIFNDADIEIAVKGALHGKFRNTGQTCVCVNRILVQDGIYDEFAAAFTKAVQGLHVGNGLEAGVTQGPLINEASLEKVEKHVQDAVSKGAKVLVGGKRHSLGRSFYEPTILSDANDEMLIFREEVFGPVAPLMRFHTDEEAIKMANDTEFGLAAYAYTENIEHGWRVAEALDYGMVGLNETLISTEVAPFGGTKQSGLGREGSNYGIDEYLELKYLCLGNIKQPFMC